MRVNWTDEAKADLRAIADRLARLSSSAGLDFVDDATRASIRLAEFPDSGRVVPEFQSLLIREVIVGRYRLVYERFPDRIEVIAVHPAALPFGR